MRLRRLVPLLALVLLAPGCLESMDAPERRADRETSDDDEPPAREPPPFLPPLDPPTRDPVEPYGFDPTLPALLTREEGVLTFSCGYDLQNGTPERRCPPQEPAPPCDPHDAAYPTEHTDADGDRIDDGFEAHVRNATGPRVRTLVDFVCPITWDHVLDVRERHGHFPVDSVWTTGIAAALTPEQVETLAARPDVRLVEGVRPASGSLDEEITPARARAADGA